MQGMILITKYANLLFQQLILLHAFLHTFIYLNLRIWKHMPQHACGGQRITFRVYSVLLPCGHWGSNLRHPAWKHVPLH